jgi:hypothetical protein
MELWLHCWGERHALLVARQRCTCRLDLPVYCPRFSRLPNEPYLHASISNAEQFVRAGTALTNFREQKNVIGACDSTAFLGPVSCVPCPFHIVSLVYFVFSHTSSYSAFSTFSFYLVPTCLYHLSRGLSTCPGTRCCKMFRDLQQQGS